MPGNSSRRLTRRPMETPGLDVNRSSPQATNQYNYVQPAMYSPQDPQSLQSQQQFYYNDFTSIPSQPQQSFPNNDFIYSGPVDNNQRQHYVPSIYYPFIIDINKKNFILHSKL